MAGSLSLADDATLSVGRRADMIWIKRDARGACRGGGLVPKPRIAQDAGKTKR
jgi:hypothetical protein